MFFTVGFTTTATMQLYWNSISHYADTEGDDHIDQGSTVYFYGNDNANSFTGDALADRMYGGNGEDYLNGLGGNDHLFGGNDKDWLDGGDGHDYMYGGNGDDWFFGGAGSDYMHGGAGFDTVDYSFSNGQINLNLETGLSAFNDAAGDTLISIEGVWATNFDDLLIGSSVDNYFWAGNGDDQVFGGDGADEIHGGHNSINIGDQLWGGADADSFHFGYGDSGVDVAADTIHDFEVGLDTMHFDVGDPSAASFGESYQNGTLTLEIYDPSAQGGVRYVIDLVDVDEGELSVGTDILFL